MSKKTGILVTIASLLAVMALCLSVISLTRVNSLKQDQKVENEDVQYVVYLGTNAQGTDESPFTPDEAKQKLDEILSEHFAGYTVQEAVGGWKNEDGSISHEFTLVIYLSDTTIDAIHAASAEMIQEFDQSCVLIQENKTTTEFYYGN